MKVLSLSGGGSKIVSLLSSTEIILNETNFKPTDIVGNSAGALTAYICSLSYIKPYIHTIIRDRVLNLKPQDIFSVSPITQKGKFAWWNVLKQLIKGKNSIAIQDITKLIKCYVSEELHNEFRENDKCPNVWVLAVRPKDMKRFLVNLKSVSYIDALKWLSASSHIPVVAQPILIDGDLFLDGGLRHHNPSPKYIDMFRNDIEEVWSIYTRLNTIDLYEAPKWNDSVYSVMERSITGMILELSKRDAEYEMVKSIEYNFELNQFFYPANILKSQLDFNNCRLKKLQEVTIQKTYEQLDNLNLRH